MLFVLKKAHLLMQNIPLFTTLKGFILIIKQVDISNAKDKLPADNCMFKIPDHAMLDIKLNFV